MRTKPARAAAGISIVYLCVAMTSLAAVVSLAVDLGRAQLVKTELQRAADAAARFGMAGLRSGVADAERNAKDAARDNTADGTPVELAPGEDIEFGTWAAKTKAFTPIQGVNRRSANAIRVTARRTEARGTAVPLLFARVVGVRACDVAASAIAIRAGYTLVGIDSVNLNGVAVIDSYNSSQGPYNPANAGDKAVVISNGNFTLIGNPTIRGDAHPGPGGTIYGSANVTGSTAPLGAPFDFPLPTVDPNYNNAPISPMLKRGGRDLDMGGRSTYTIKAGVYSVRDISLAGTASLRISGDVTLYVSGNVSLNGNVQVLSTRPGDFKVRMTSTNKSMSYNGNVPFYADVYAPGSDVTIGGTGDLYGTVVGKTLKVSGRAGIHYDEMISPYGGYAGGIVLVR